MSTGKQEALVLTTPEPNGKSEECLKAWALVELMGHQRLVGMVVVDPPEFPGMTRVDVPDLLKDGKVVRKGFSSFFGKSAFYRVTPISEDMVRQLLPSIDGTPVMPLGLGSYNRNGQNYEEGM